MIPIIEHKTKAGRRQLNNLLSRTQLDYGDVSKTVEGIVNDVRTNGDKALFAYTEQFDLCLLNKKNLLVSKEEITQAYELISEELTEILRRAVKRIAAFHEKQKRNTWLEPAENGEMLGQMIRPIENVGVYSPGGTAAYPSSVLMNIVPARVAGVKNIFMCTPPDKNGKINPAILVAADLAGADKIYKAGGAQAIAAMAFGTETIPKADKIVGPGNIYVATAKRIVFGYVNIDSIAGPSEILIIADNRAKAKYVAADLLAQAEHDILAAAILITTSKKLAERVQAEIETQLTSLDRREIAKKSLESYGAIILVDSLEDAVALSNKIAPEHLELCTNDNFALLPLIKNAGAVFMGNYTPEAIGDYMAGPNHILPTGGTARFYSPLSVDDFIKKTSLLSFGKEAFKTLAKDVATFADAEGLTGHANSIRVRMK